MDEKKTNIVKGILAGLIALVIILTGFVYWADNTYYCDHCGKFNYKPETELLNTYVYEFDGEIYDTYYEAYAEYSKAYEKAYEEYEEDYEEAYEAYEEAYEEEYEQYEEDYDMYCDSYYAEWDKWIYNTSENEEPEWNPPEWEDYNETEWNAPEWKAPEMIETVNTGDLTVAKCKKCAYTLIIHGTDYNENVNEDLSVLDIVKNKIEEMVN